MSEEQQSETHRECWDCGCTEFHLNNQDGVLSAECVDCGGKIHPANLYTPDENGREYYEMEMNHA